MKNLNIILICVLGILSLVSCNDDRDNNPKYENPTEFVLNTPKYAERVLGFEKYRRSAAHMVPAGLWICSSSRLLCTGTYRWKVRG